MVLFPIPCKTRANDARAIHGQSSERGRERREWKGESGVEEERGKKAGALEEEENKEGSVWLPTGGTGGDEAGTAPGHEKVFPIPGVNTRGYCSHLKPLSVRMRANEKEGPSGNQGGERRRARRWPNEGSICT